MPDLQGAGGNPAGAKHGEFLAQLISHDRLFDEVDAVLKIALLLFQTDHSDKASDLLGIAVALLQRLPECSRRDELAANLRTVFGMTLSAEKRQAEAAEQFAESAHLYSSLNNNAGLYYSTLAEGIRLRDNGRAQEALALFRRAEAIDRTHNVELESSRRYALQIDVVGALIQTECTSEIVKQINECLKWIPYTPCREVAGLLLQQGNYSALFGDYKEALAAYKSGVETAEALHDVDMKARFLSRTALCYRTQAEQTGDAAALQRSADYRRTALQTYIEGGSMQEALTQSQELASALQSLQDYKGARDACLTGAHVASQGGFAPEQFRFTAHAAFLSVLLRDYDSAIDLYGKASRFPDASTGDRQKVLGELARLHYSKGENDDAVRLFSESCNLLAEIGDRSGEEGKEREALAYLLIKLGRAGEAQPHLRRLQELTQSGSGK